jgi:Nuclease A inhibitor-like protein
LRYLETLVDGLYADYTFTSDGGDISQAFVWDVESQGTFYFSKLLERFELLQSISLDEFLDRWQRSYDRNSEEIAQQCQLVIESMQNHVARIEIYELKTFGQSAGQKASDGFGGWDCVQFILGETSSGDWVGIAPKLRDTSGWTKAIHIQQEEYQPSNPASQFLSHIAAVSESLNKKFIQSLFSASSVDDSIYRFAEIEGITFRAASNRDTLIEGLLGAGNLLGAYPFEGFTVSDDVEYDLVALEEKLNSTGLSENDQQRLSKYRQSKTLKDFLASELSGAQLYQLGYGVCIRHYIFGQLANQDWAGIVSFSVYS